MAEARAWEAANIKKVKEKQKKPNATRITSFPTCWTNHQKQAVICRGSSNRPFVCSALMAEALAIKDALFKAKDLNLQSLQLFRTFKS